MMRYIGFGVGHVDSAVRANTVWPAPDQSISEIIQGVHIDEEFEEGTGIAEDDDLDLEYETASNASDDDPDDNPDAVDNNPHACL